MLYESELGATSTLLMVIDLASNSNHILGIISRTGWQLPESNKAVSGPKGGMTPSDGRALSAIKDYYYSWQGNVGVLAPCGISGGSLYQ